MKDSKKRDCPTPEEIQKAFTGYIFGGDTPDKIVKYSLLRIVSGVIIGHAAKRILQELGLLSTAKKPRLTPRGQYTLWNYFKPGHKTGMIEE